MNSMMSRFKSDNDTHRAHGFTLLEVLAALAVISIALVALFSSLSQSTRLTARVEERMIGNWVASNAITELKSVSDWPDIGENTSDVNMAGRVWHVSQEIQQTADENIRRIDITVSLDEKGSYQVASLFGYFINPKPVLSDDNQLQITN